MKLILNKIVYFFTFCLLSTFVHATLDLQDLVDDFVISTKRIHIPGYPRAFNPSIIRWNGRYLMSFRVLPDPKKKFDCVLGLVWLDDQFNIDSTPQILNTGDPLGIIPSRIDDARLVIINEKLWLVYADNKEKEVSRGGFRVYIGELIQEKNNFNILQQECLAQFEGQSRDKREKNWTPFDYQGHMLLAYQLNPHAIFFPHLGTNSCTTFAKTKTKTNWQWGELRGGTPAVLDGDHYLSFFHSTIDMNSIQSFEKKSSHYFMGAYTFSKEYPFQISHMSKKPIVGPTCYEKDIYKPYWKPVTVIYPCGFVVNGQSIWLAYGQHDNETWIMQLDKKGLMQSLIPVKSD